MSLDDLREEINGELELMNATVNELLSLKNDAQQRVLTVRELTATATFLAQFYNGVENILKRICMFYNVPIPNSGQWHTKLFKQFCHPPQPPLPLLLDQILANDLSPYRRFRHVAVHGYGVQLDWTRMETGVAQTEQVFIRFKSKVLSYLESLELNELNCQFSIGS